METAVLRLGLAGFDGPDEAAIRKAAAAYASVDWRCGGTDGADAWLVNAARVTGTSGTHVRVITADASGRMVPIVIDSASRPFAIGQPAKLSAVLRQFDHELHATKACYWAAAHILAHHETVGKAMYELHAGDELLAVVDMKGTAAISPTAAESAFDRAVWKHRARKAVTIPAWFRSVPLQELMWQYVTRTRRELLPARYRECTIYFRRPARVDPQMIDDVHLLVSRQLALGPSTLAELQTVLVLEEPQVAQALAALYYVGSITSNPDRAWRGSVRGGLWSQPAPLEGDVPTAPPARVARDAPPSTAPLL